MREGEIIQDGFWAGAKVLAVYSRAQAIDDGMLVDLSESGLPQESGFKFPVACSAAVWSLIEPTEAEESYGQDFKGRMWDVLMMLHLAIKRQSDGHDTTAFDVIFQMRGRSGYRAGQRTVRLKAICGPGDDAEPVITILLPRED